MVYYIIIYLFIFIKLTISISPFIFCTMNQLKIQNMIQSSNSFVGKDKLQIKKRDRLKDRVKKLYAIINNYYYIYWKRKTNLDYIYIYLCNVKKVVLKMKSNFSWKNHYLLCITSSPYLFVSYKLATPILKLCFVSLFITSQLFWFVGKENNKLHKLDSLVAKCTAIITLYYMFIKNQFPHFFVVASLLLTIKSHIESKKKWCSNYHIIIHCLLHIVSIYAIIKSSV